MGSDVSIMNYTHLIKAGNSCFAIEAYYKKTFNNKITLFNKHPSYEIMYVASGNCHVNFVDEENESKKESYLLGKNQFVFIDSGTVHQLITDEKCVIYNIELKLVPCRYPSFYIGEYFKANPQLRLFYHDNFRYVISNDTQRVWKIIKTIHAETNERKNTRSLLDEFSCSSLLQGLVWDMLINIFKCVESEKLLSTAGCDHINNALQYIKDNFKDNELCVNDIANHIKINRTYFQKLFHKQTQKTVVQYINELRINEAAYLIKNTDKSITDICFDVGYNNRQNFFRAFKKLMKIGPNEYRKEITNKEVEVYGKFHESDIVYTD